MAACSTASMPCSSPRLCCGTLRHSPLSCTDSMKRIAILGSTGSIGRSTLSIVESYPERFSVIAMAAGGNLEQALKDAKRWKPKLISMATAEKADALRRELKSAGLSAIEVASGSEGAVKVATHKDVDFVVSAIVGV